MTDADVGHYNDAILYRYGKILSQRALALWERLTIPPIEIRQPVRYRQARLLASMLVVLILIGAASEAYMIYLGYSVQAVSHRIAVGAVLVLLMGYLLNRRGHLILAAWATTLTLSIAIFELTFDTGGLPVEVDFLAYLFIPLLFASVFLSGNMILALGLLYTGGIFGWGLCVPGVNWLALVNGPGVLVPLSCGLVYLVGRQRNAEETERRRELAEKEETYRSLFEGANDAIFLMNTDGVNVAVNQKAADMLGYAISELVGKPMADIVAPDQYDRAEQAKKVIMAGEVLPPYKRMIDRKDGMQFPVEINASLICGRDGQPLLIQSIVHDITERERSETRIQRQLDRLKALREIDRMITSGTDLRSTLQVVLDHVINLLACDAADVYLLNQNLGQLEFCVGRGFPPGASELFTALSWGEPVDMERMLAGQAKHMTDFKSDPIDNPRAQWLARHGFAIGFAVPLAAKGALKGVLEVFRRKPGEPTLAWVDFLETLAGQAAIAVDNVGLFQSLQRSNQDLTRSYDATLEGWARALELRDKETEGHSQRVTDLTLRLAHALGIDDENELVHLRRGALLHDIGKMGIPDAILLKPGPLTDEEWKVMRLHPGYARDMLSPIPFLTPALDIPYAHHERWDGSGYPQGLQGEAIPLAARIFAVVDAWDALTNDRPYRPAWEEATALAYLREQAGILFDPRVVEVFLGLEEGGDTDCADTHG